MENTCNYSDQWQPYIGDYDKYEYDIILQDRSIVNNCYPNGGVFMPLLDQNSIIDESLVAEIRFSQSPTTMLNKNVSSVSVENVYNSDTPLNMHSPMHIKAYKDMEYIASDWIRTEKIEPFVRESPKISRNSICPHCNSGKKWKKCCSDK